MLYAEKDTKSCNKIHALRQGDNLSCGRGASVKLMPCKLETTDMHSAGISQAVGVGPCNGTQAVIRLN